MELENKTFLITGASKGIGYAVAKVLDAEGANLILVARDTGSINLDGDHKLINADLTKHKGIQTVLTAVANTNLDALLNIAGIGVYKPLEELEEVDFRESIELNLMAPFLLIKGLHQNVAQSDLSLILTIGSGAGVMPFKNRSAYCTSKFGLRGLILSLAEEFESKTPDYCLITLGSVITTFGGKSIKQQQEDLESGAKAAFPVEWVANKLVEIIKDPQRETEIVLYPSEYGLDEWKKP